MTEQLTFTPQLIEEIRSRFVHVDADSLGRRIYFENAGGTLKLQTVLETQATFTALPDNEGRRNAASEKVTAAIERGRADAALFLGATSKIIVADQSATAMLFRLVETVVRSRPRGNIVTSNLEHASAYDATHVVAARHGVEARIAPLDPVSGRVPVESVMNCVDRHTVCLTLIHASNVLGTRNDVAEVVRRARAASPDIFIILDGAQHASHGRIDVDEYGGDAYLFVPYKTYSKIGISFATLTNRLAVLPHDNLRGKPQDFWDLGTREVASYACMSCVVDYFRWLGRHFTESDDPRAQVVAGMAGIERYELELLRAMLHGTGSARGLLHLDPVTVYGETEHLKEREAIIAFNVRGKKTADLVDYFERHGVRLSNRTRNVYSRHTLEALGIEECLRVSLAHYNTVGEIEVFLKLLAKTL